MLVTSDNNSISTGVWTHVAITFDGSTTAANVHIYVNGVEVSYQTQTNGGSQTPTTGNFHLGNRDDGNRPTDGIIADAVYYDTQLTLEQVNLHYKSQLKYISLQIQLSNLKGYWPLDDQPDGTRFDGDTAVDRSGNGNNGTGNDGGNNTGLTAKAEEILTYP